MTKPTFIQILDSRATPTIMGAVQVDSTWIKAKVPSGASTGVHEALELRDKRTEWMGKSVLGAVDSANHLATLVSWTPADFKNSDKTICSLDKVNKSRLGANATLAVSILQARLQAHQNSMEPFQLFAHLEDFEPKLPLPFANVLNGGRHAGNKLQFQEFMIVPTSASSFYDATRQVVETYHCLKEIIADKYGGNQTSLGDEGGFAPDISSPQEALDLLVLACRKSGHQMSFAMDVAASEFYHPDKGYQALGDKWLSADALISLYSELVENYPIISIEDPFDQDDFESFKAFTALMTRKHVQVVGDDLTVTNPSRISRAASMDAADSLLLKINQIGTLSEAIESARIAQDHGWTIMVSHRSGETCDDIIADLAVGLSTGQIKLGAPARGERTAKYNRLLEIEALYSVPLKTW